MAVPWAVTVYGEDGRHPESQFEAPCVFFHGMLNTSPITVGAFTYSYSHISHFVAGIGRFCSIGAGVTFGAMEHETSWMTTSNVLYDPGFWGLDLPVNQLPPAEKRGWIVIKHDVWIGYSAYIRGGVTLGQGCIVGAHAVVTKDVPPYAIVAGNPARIIRYRFDEATIQDLLDSWWWNLEPKELADPALGIEHAIKAARERNAELTEERAAYAASKAALSVDIRNLEAAMLEPVDVVAPEAVGSSAVGGINAASD